LLSCFDTYHFLLFHSVFALSNSYLVVKTVLCVYNKSIKGEFYSTSFLSILPVCIFIHTVETQEHRRPETASKDFAAGFQILEFEFFSLGNNLLRGKKTRFFGQKLNINIHSVSKNLKFIVPIYTLMNGIIFVLHSFSSCSFFIYA
jgi:hypothetical protein